MDSSLELSTEAKSPQPIHHNNSKEMELMKIYEIETERKLLEFERIRLKEGDYVFIVIACFNALYFQIQNHHLLIMASLCLGCT